MRYNSARSTISEISGLLLRFKVDPLKGQQNEDRNSINFTFIVPLWPKQDRATRAHVRLLGPCFKTGQMDTDLLAIDCFQVRRDTAASIERSNTADFPCKTQKVRQIRHILDNGTLRTHCSRPRISGEIEPISSLRAVNTLITSYNTGMYSRRTHPATFL